MKCPFKFGRYEFEGGEECQPDCAWIVKKGVHLRGGDGPLVIRFVCGAISSDWRAMNTIEVEAGGEGNVIG